MKQLCVILLAGAMAFAGPTTNPSLSGIVANDNRTLAGRLHHDTLEVHLVVRMGTWHPEADSGPAIDVAAFAEEGRAPQIPGPLLRVKTGTVISATVTNQLTDSTISIHGLMTRPAAAWDSVVLRPGETRVLTFPAGAPGAYLYRAMLGHHSIDRQLSNEREQLAGAFIVDPIGGAPPDRILMINIWGSRVDSANWNQQDYRNALTINGRSWPYTERLTAQTGDTLRLQVINASGRTHPMHLHGFYFKVNARGDGLADTLFAPDAGRLAVTEEMRPYASMQMSIVPDRPGNWLLHCHVGFHVTPHARLNKPGHESHDAGSHDPGTHMAGLVMGITVRPAPGYVAAPPGERRRMHLFIQEGISTRRSPRALGFVLQEGGTPPRPDSVVMPGSLLVLTRGQPTDIVVINRLKETSAIHWHGIELESFSDGVAGWSGADTILAPSIEPGDSFVAHLTLPRAGTFIYHTHMNDLEQLSSGLYGGIVVLEPGRSFDPSTDHAYVAGWDSPFDPPRLVINGQTEGPTLELAAGSAQRFRFINIGIALPVRFTVQRDTAVVRWRRLAKDGADLPSSQATAVAARQRVQVGETYDFELKLDPGEYQLIASSAPPGGLPPVTFYHQRLIVH